MLALELAGAQLKISSINRDGALAWTNAFNPGICTLESATSLPANWQPQQNLYTTSSVGRSSFTLQPGNRFYRLLAVDISTNSPRAFSNLVVSYGILRTI